MKAMPPQTVFGSGTVRFKRAGLATLGILAFALVSTTSCFADPREVIAEKPSDPSSLFGAGFSKSGATQASLHQEAEQAAQDKRRDETVAWLKDHPLTSLAAERDVWPKPEETCPARNLRMTRRPLIHLEQGVEGALTLSRTSVWAFVRFDVEKDGRPLKVVAIDSAGLPSYDKAAVAAVEAARFSFSNGVDLAKGCLAFFRDAAYVGIGPVSGARLMRHRVSRKTRPAAAPRKVALRRPKPMAAPAPERPPATPYGALPLETPARDRADLVAPTRSEAGEGQRTGTRSDRIWTPARDPVEGERIDCFLLSDRLSRPARCQK